MAPEFPERRSAVCARSARVTRAGLMVRIFGRIGYAERARSCRRIDQSRSITGIGWETHERGLRVPLSVPRHSARAISADGRASRASRSSPSSSERGGAAGIRLIPVVAAVRLMLRLTTENAGEIADSATVITQIGKMIDGSGNRVLERGFAFDIIVRLPAFIEFRSSSAIAANTSVVIALLRPTSSLHGVDSSSNQYGLRTSRLQHTYESGVSIGRHVSAERRNQCFLRPHVVFPRHSM